MKQTWKLKLAFILLSLILMATMAASAVQAETSSLSVTVESEGTTIKQSIRQRWENFKKVIDEKIESRDEGETRIIIERNGERQEHTYQDGFQDQVEQQQLEQNQVQVRRHVAQVHAERLRKRFLNTYYQRLWQIIHRLEARLETMAENGHDVTSAQAKLVEAKQKLAEAKTLSEQAITDFEDLTTTGLTDQRDQALQARDLALEARKAFQATLRLLKEAVRLAHEAI